MSSPTSELIETADSPDEYSLPIQELGAGPYLDRQPPTDMVVDDEQQRRGIDFGESVLDEWVY